MFRHFNKALWRNVAPVQCKYYTYNKNSSMSTQTHSELEDVMSIIAVAASPEELERGIDAVSNNFTSINIDVTSAVKRNNQTVSKDKIQLIKISLEKTPKLSTKFHKCNIFGEVIFSIAQVSDILLSFLLENGRDVNDVAEVIGLLCEIKKSLSSEIASGVIKFIVGDKHLKIFSEILNKHNVSTNGELYEFYCCFGNLLMLYGKLRACLFNFNLWFS